MIITGYAELLRKPEEHSLTVTGKEFSLQLKGKVRTKCVRICLNYDSETYPMNVENEVKLDRNEMSMLR